MTVLTNYDDYFNPEQKTDLVFRFHQIQQRFKCIVVFLLFSGLELFTDTSSLRFVCVCALGWLKDLYVYEQYEYEQYEQYGQYKQNEQYELYR